MKYIEDVSQTVLFPQQYIEMFGPVLKGTMPGHHYTNTAVLLLVVLARYLNLHLINLPHS